LPVSGTVDQPAVPVLPIDPPPAPRPRRRGRVAIVLLSIALFLAAGALAAVIVLLMSANDTIDERDQEIREQQELIEKKETFGAAVTSLIDTASSFNGLRTPTVVPYSDYELLVQRAWYHRWKPDALDRDIAAVAQHEADLIAFREAAVTEAGANTTGTTSEATIDQLGGGYVASLVYEADEFCGSDVLACVSSDDPYTVHFDADELDVEYTNSWIETGIAYHEFAHVLQMTNPDETEIALEAFGGDDEIMADCYALTYLDGWSLDQRVWITSYSWWDVSFGYGHTCDDTQRQAVVTWYDSLGFTATPISQ
jgi:hypothetical protein